MGPTSIVLNCCAFNVVDGCCYFPVSSTCQTNLQREFPERRRRKKKGKIVPAKVIDTNEPVVEDGLSAIVSLLGFCRSGKLHHGPFKVSIIANLEKEGHASNTTYTSQRQNKNNKCC